MKMQQGFEWTDAPSTVSGYIPSTGTGAQLAPTGTTSGLQLKIGSRIPELSGVDQFGMQQKIESLKILETHSDLQNLETVQTRLSKITLCRT